MIEEVPQFLVPDFQSFINTNIFLTQFTELPMNLHLFSDGLHKSPLHEHPDDSQWSWR